MRQNRHCQIYWQILYPEKNAMRSTMLQVRLCKSPWLLRGQKFGIAVQCGRGQGNVQQMWTWCGQRTEAADALRTAGTNFLSAPSPIGSEVFIPVRVSSRLRFGFGFYACWKNVTSCLFDLYLTGLKPQSECLCVVGNRSVAYSGSKFAEQIWIRCCDRKSRAACAQSFAPWQQATIEIMLAISLTIVCSIYIYNGVILHAHPVRGESHNQRNTTGEVATPI